MRETIQRLSVLLVALVSSVATFAYDACIDGIYYNLMSKAKQAEVTYETTSYNSYSGSVTIPETVTYDGVTYSVTSIGERAFFGCKGLKSVTIPNSVRSIGTIAFWFCLGLTSVNITDLAAWCEIDFHDNPLHYGHHLFLNGEEIKDLVIPNAVTSIGGQAFYYCTGLTSVTIPNSVTSIGKGAFSNCEGLTSIKVESGNTTYDSRNDCNAIIKTSGNELMFGCKNTIIPNSVTSIGSEAFLDCSGLTSVTIPNSVTSISSGAFEYCTGLTSVTIPNSVTSIGDGAFSECSGLTSVTIPNSVTSIGNRAFYDCSGLTSVTIGNSVTSIGSEAFSGCKNIENVYCYAEKVPSTETDVFRYAYTEYATLYVPETSIDAYKAEEPWSNFGAFKAIESGQEKPACATPTISVVNGKLHFECETEGAGFHYSITQTVNNVSGAYTEDDVDFATTPTYIVTCYATADGYVQSETVTATITIDKADVNSDGTVDISDVNKVISVICGGE